MPHDISGFGRFIRHPSSDETPTPLELVSAPQYDALPQASDGTDAIRFPAGETPPSSSDPWWMAGICKKLPEGVYRFDGTFDDDSLASGALGWLLAHYRFDHYRSEPKPLPVRILILPKTIELEPIIQEAESIAFVRDLVNTPAEDMGPAELEAAARDLANAFGATIDTVVGENLLKENFAAIHTVGRAAPPSRAPRLIELNWGETGDTKVTLVGKGVCFDTGGLGVKPGGPMRKMKKDMAGAAHALGLARRIMAAKLPIRLRVLIPAVDNNISKESYRPGDVIKTRKGLTVEIDHTDAEGRLVLCDALALASEDAPDILLDFATLTGANTMAIGPDLAGVYTPSDELWSTLEKESRRIGDPVWRMPLWAPYARKLKSHVADTNHRTPGFEVAGNITAALFLQKFVSPESQWAHFDFYAWHDDAQPGRPIGGAVMGIRAVFEALARR